MPCRRKANAVSMICAWITWGWMRSWLRVYELGLKGEEEHLENVIVELQYRAPGQEDWADEALYRTGAALCLQALDLLWYFNHPDSYRRNNTEPRWSITGRETQSTWGAGGQGSALTAITMNVEVKILSAARMRNMFTTLDSRRADFVLFRDHGIKPWKE